MDNIFDGHSPLYVQLIHRFKVLIANGTWQSGQRVQSVRDLAVMYKVNPNTVQRALVELEREKLMYTERTSGRYISLNQTLIDQMRRELAKEELSRFCLSMQGLGFKDRQIQEMISEYLFEGEDSE